MKRCSKCGETKPHDNFGKNRCAKDGLASWCKACCHAYVYEDPDYRARKLSYNQARYQAKNSEILEKARQRYKADPLMRRRVRSYVSQRYHSDPIYRARKREWNHKYNHSKRGHDQKALDSRRRRDRQRGLHNTLTYDQWREIVRQQHYKCLACGRRFGSLLKPTRDHIDPRKGLSLDNCQALCQSCNSRKSAKHIDYRPLKQASFDLGDV